MRSTVEVKRTPAEWVTLAISIVIVGTLVVVALLEEAKRSHETDFGIAVTFERDDVIVKGEQFYVPYRVTNIGGSAISSAEVWIEVMDERNLLETAEVTVSFLPLNGHQEGIYVSKFDPERYAFTGRLESLLFP